jgi:REP element-mobilizing transposase RayT
MKNREYYKRNLPHIQPMGDIFFVTARLVNSIPNSVIAELQSRRNSDYMAIMNRKDLSRKEQRESHQRLQKLYFKRFDTWLDRAGTKDDFLARAEVAAIVKDKFHEYDGKFYDLIAYTIMPNHFHLLIDFSVQLNNTQDYVQLEWVMKYIKGGSAYTINKTLGRKGQFWQRESYDRVVRDEREFYNIIRYILLNPVKTNLVEYWGDWEYSYVKNMYSEVMSPSMEE